MGRGVGRDRRQGGVGSRAGQGIRGRGQGRRRDKVRQGWEGAVLGGVGQAEWHLEVRAVVRQVNIKIS
jgi:hypothetical protein